MDLDAHYRALMSGIEQAFLVLDIFVRVFPPTISKVLNLYKAKLLWTSHSPLELKLQSDSL